MAVATVRRFQELKRSLAPRIKELKYTFHLIRKSLLTLAGLIMISGFFIVGILAWLAPSWVAPYPEDVGFVLHPEETFEPPSPDHWFGTDEFGRDHFSRVILATPVDLQIAFVVVGSALGIGIVLGVLAGFFGGWIDEVFMRVTDVFLAVPGLVLAIAFTAVLGRGLFYVMLALVIVWWPSYTRLIRGQALSVRENLYIEAARAVGASNFRIVFRHLLPNTLAPVIVNATLDLGSVIIVAAALGFLGLGQPPPYPEWGRLISDGQDYVLTGEWWYYTFPGIAILLTVLAFNLAGDGLRDVLDPRLRR